MLAEIKRFLEIRMAPIFLASRFIEIGMGAKIQLKRLVIVNHPGVLFADERF